MSNPKLELAAAAVCVMACNNYLLHAACLLEPERKKRKCSVKVQEQPDEEEPLDSVPPMPEWTQPCPVAKEDFEFIMDMIGHRIARKHKSYRDAIPAKTRLELTIRFLTTGAQYQPLQEEFNISAEVIPTILKEVCTAIVEGFEDYVKMPATRKDWIATSKPFEDDFKIPHSLGVLAGTRISLKSFPMDLFHLMMLTLVDSSCKFLYVDVFPEEFFDDNPIFNKINYNDHIFPPAKPLLVGQVPVPYVFLSDHIFASSKRIMKPFPGVRPEGSRFTIFNEAISRAMGLTKYALTILAYNFGVLRKPLLQKDGNAVMIVKACVALHNFLKESEYSKDLYMPQENFAVLAKEMKTSFSPIMAKPRISGHEAQLIREEFAKYFVQRRGRSKLF